MKHIIKSLEPGSPLWGKVKPGEALLAVNGRPIQDVLDYKFYAYDRRLVLTLETPEGRKKLVSLRKGPGEDPGLSFESYLMDAPRSCANRCVFCFIDQMPPGQRPSLYFKDDDARLSFLMGCYITLTNLSEREIQRIIDLRISPINISVHATDPELRRKMLNHPRAGRCMDIMKRLASARIGMNCQIVCCPGWNDGAALQRTMEDLLSLCPAVHSVSVVPVGLTRFREGLTNLSPFTPESAGETVRQVEDFAARCLRTTGRRVFWCADELYIKAGLPLPSEDYYADFPQLENGVGMLRSLESEFSLALKLSEKPDGRDFTIACGEAAAPFLRNLLCTARKKYAILKGQVISVRNDFFGGEVTVSGLLTGRDLLAQLRDRELGERVLITRSMLRQDEVDFLDGMTLEDLSLALGRQVYPVENDGAALWEAMAGQLPPIPRPKPDVEDTPYNRYNQ